MGKDPFEVKKQKSSLRTETKTPKTAIMAPISLIDHLLFTKSLVILWGISLRRTFIRPFSGRTETVWATQQYNALNRVLTYLDIEDLGFSSTMNLGCDHSAYTSQEAMDMFEGHQGLSLQSLS